MKDRKIIFKCFFVFDYEKEELWLRDMANKGLFLEKVIPPGVYFFKKGQPQDLIYKVDCTTGVKDKEEYISFFKEYEFEYICNKKFFRYFKYTGEINNYNSDVKIYNNEEVQGKLFKRILYLIMAVIGLEISCLITPFVLGTNFQNYLVLIGLDIFLFIITIKFLNSFRQLLKREESRKEKSYYGEGKEKKKIYSKFIIIAVVSFFITSIFLINVSTISGNMEEIKKEILIGGKIYEKNK